MSVCGALPLISEAVLACDAVPVTLAPCEARMYIQQHNYDSIPLNRVAVYIKSHPYQFLLMLYL